jgi:hypothetical protein
MTIKNKNIILKMIVGIFLITVLNFNLFGLIWANYSPLAFCEDCEKNSKINIFVIEGGGYFLNAYSDILLLLNKIELSDLKGIDYEELQRIVDNAVSSMTNARAAYSSLVEVAGATSYNPDSIQKLKNFDYDGFQQENGLNSIIFNDLVFYLKRGDVRGFYARLLTHIDNLLQRTNLIKSVIDTERFPNIRDLWQLNKEFSYSLMFGQYAARVFYETR